MPEDQSDLDIAREHFVLTMNSFKNALQRGVDPFYNKVLDGLEAIAEMTQDFERGDFKLEEYVQVQIIPPSEMKYNDWEKMYNNINSCPVCGSNDIKKVLVIEMNCGTDGTNDDSHRCGNCDYVFAVEFFIGEHLIIRDQEPENSDSQVQPSDK